MHHHTPPPPPEAPLDEHAGAALDPRRLIVFAEVARRGSFAAAAAALGWTQPAVAQHVRRLEREAGCALVARTARGVVLSEAGRALAVHAEALGLRLRAAREELAALADLRTGRVRVAAFPSACATVVPRAVARLGERAPAVDVRLTEAEPPEARALLASGEVDLAVTFDYPDSAEPGRAQDVPLADDPLVLVLPAGHARAGRPDTRLADVADERWIAGCPQCRAHLLAAAAGAGFTPDIRHSTDDYVVTQALVASGLGVALLPALALSAARDPRVRLTHLDGHPPRRVRLRRSPEVPPGPATAALAEELRRAWSQSGVALRPNP